ncbi:MAG TPA: hypothetical protein VFB20_17620 [Burkholderiales bacterium]|nr:hypothetical protein [Burkholderiales bacterium]
MQRSTPVLGRRPTCVIASLLLTISLLPAPSAFADAGEEKGRFDDSDRADPVMLSFSTVGDSRQDPVSPDPTQLPLSGQDAIWLENTKVFLDQ